MYTPRKNSNYNSPYTNSMQQYPSQSEDYISFGSGGSVQSSGNVRSGQQHHNSRGLNWQKRGKKNFYGSTDTNTPTGNNSGQKQWGSPRKGGGSGGGPHRNKYHPREKNEPANHISTYIHPSMTDDPWKELMHRIEALNNSKISIQSEEKCNESEPAESNDDEEESIETKPV